MAALTLPTQATYEVHEHVKVDTNDNEDHTFCGIMFPIRCKNLLPIEHIIIKSVAVRGALGPLTVYVSNVPETTAAEANAANQNQGLPGGRPRQDNNNNEHIFRLSPRHWTKIYEHTHEPSLQEYQTLTFTEPVVMLPNQVRCLYVHSQAEGDDAIVYDNSSVGPHRHDDSMITIYSGKAHLSPIPFGQTPIWGWGTAYRDHREFVGTLEYATRYKLWTPNVHDVQGTNFRQAVLSMLSCQRDFASPVARLPDECLYYIMNMCRWDWFGDDAGDLRVRRRLRRSREREAERLQQEQREALGAGDVDAVMEQDATQIDGTNQEQADAGEGRGNGVGGGGGCCHRRAASASSAEQDEAFHDAVESEEDEDFDVDTESDFSDEIMEDSDAIDNAIVEDFSVEDSEDEEGQVDEDDEVISLDGSEGLDDDDDDDDDDDAISVDDSDESDWERAQGYRADGRVFRLQVADSDDDEPAAPANGEEEARHAWFGRNVFRIHVLRAIAAGDAADAAVGQDDDADMDA